MPDSHATDMIRQLVLDQTGMYFGPGKAGVLKQHVSAACRDLGIAGPLRLYEALTQGGAAQGQALATLIQQVTVNHTTFFREMAGYDHLEATILPTLSTHGEIRAWSSAAASGEELYTLAIVLAERLGLNTLAERWKFLGTDINGKVVAEAERGVYAGHRIARVPASLLRKYFLKIGKDTYQVCPEIRALCTFRVLNLAHFPYPFQRGFHLVYCRNLLYYFSEKVQQRVLGAIYTSTRNHGWLVTSVSESVDALDTAWQRSAPSLFYRDDAAHIAVGAGSAR